MKLKKCRHFNGLIGGMRKDHMPCKLGLNVRDYSDPGIGRGIRLACLSDEVVIGRCPKFDPYTQAEVDDDEKEIAEYIQKTMLARTAIVSHMADIGAKSGIGDMPCPVCKTGRVFYSVSEYNGHIHANCNTKDCVGFME